MSTRERSMPSLASSLERDTSCRLGQLVAGSTPERWLVDYPGNPLGPLPALSVLALEPRHLEYAVAAGQPVLLMFEQGDPSRPIVVGLIEPSSADAHEMRRLLVSDRAQRSPFGAAKREAHIDAMDVTLEGYEQVTLKCGEASITLRKNGKIQLKGVSIETDAAELNRIKGGTVKIN